MPGISGFYDPLHHIDSQTTQNIIRKTTDPKEHKTPVKFSVPEDRVYCQAVGWGNIPASIVFAKEYKAVIFGRIISSATNQKVSYAEILSSVARDGGKYLQELDGNFLISMWLPADKDMYIINDAFGSYPVNYYYHKGLFLFSTQLVILKNLIPDNSVNESVMAELLGFGFILNGKSLLNNSQRLWPGSILRIRKDRIDTENYFAITYQPNHKQPLKERLDQFSERFENSIQNKIDPSNLPAGGLSGGYDSRVLWAVLRKFFPGMTAVTFGEKNSADLEVSQKLMQRAAMLHETYILKQDDFRNFYDDLMRIVTITEGYSPFDLFILIPYYKWLATKYEALIDGTGSALYRRQIFRKYQYILHPRNDLASFICKFYMQNFFNTDLINPEFYGNYFPTFYSQLAEYFERLSNRGRPEDLLDIFYLHHFVGFRFASDTIFQSQYLDTIHPFCDKELYQLLTTFTVKERQKMQIHRHLIHRYSRDFEEVPIVGSSMVIPYRNFRLNRLLFITASRFTRTSLAKFKSRPVFDFDHAFRTFLKKDLVAILSDPLTHSRHFWNIPYLERLVRDHMGGVKDNSRSLMQITLAEMLMRRFG